GGVHRRATARRLPRRRDPRRGARRPARPLGPPLDHRPARRQPHICARPPCALSIAREPAGRVEPGVIYDPSHGELYVAERGRGAFCNGTPLAVSATRSLDESLLTTGFPYAIGGD